MDADTKQRLDALEAKLDHCCALLQRLLDAVATEDEEVAPWEPIGALREPGTPL